MKKLKLATMLALLIPAVSVAETPRLVNGDGSKLSALCIAAAEASSPLSGSVLDPVQRKELLCNGQPVDRFVLHIRKQSKQLVFQTSDESALSRLCLAAIRSEEDYRRIASKHFADERNLEQNVYCNGVPLPRFVRKYRGRQFTAGL